MKRKTAGISMALCGMKKVSGHGAPRLRTMRGLSKLLLIPHSGRLVRGLLIVLGVAAWLQVNVAGSEAPPRTWFDPDLAAAAGVEGPARDAGYTVAFGGAFLVVAGLMIASGAGRIRRTVWVIEHGVAAVAEVVEVRETTRWLMRGPRGVFTTRRVASCTFGFARSGRRSFEVDVAVGAVEAGDHLDIWHDPGMPVNVLAIDAIPRAVLAGID
jgi:hypothetical protein